MSTEKALALVVRTTDWSETSRIATLWTRELGKVRALAKGGRRLKSNFETALDLLTVCRIVFLRKSSGSLDLLTEAQVVRRFPRLRQDLPALYAAGRSAVAPLVVLSALTAVSSMTWIAGLKYSDVVVATVLSSTSPMFALGLGAMFLAERLTLAAVIGALLTIVGIVVLDI